MGFALPKVHDLKLKIMNTENYIRRIEEAAKAISNSVDDKAYENELHYTEARLALLRKRGIVIGLIKVARALFVNNFSLFDAKNNRYFGAGESDKNQLGFFIEDGRIMGIGICCSDTFTKEHNGKIGSFYIDEDWFEGGEPIALCAEEVEFVLENLEQFEKDFARYLDLNF